MGASKLEYRLRYLLHGLIYVLGLWPFWESWLGLTTKSTWLTVSAEMARQGWLGFQGATVLLLVLAIGFTGLGAWLRVWGAAYVGAGIVNSPEMHGQTLLADGPYRRSRNPLYFGTLLHTVGIALLMPPAGAVFAIAAIWILQIRLALAEEPFLTARFGQVYRDYMERVPRFLPSPKAMVPAGGQRAQWLQAVLGESYVVGVVITLAAFGWDFNAFPLLKGILISLGVSLVLRAFMPRAKPEPAQTLAA